MGDAVWDGGDADKLAASVESVQEEARRVLDRDEKYAFDHSLSCLILFLRESPGWYASSCYWLLTSKFSEGYPSNT